MAKKVKELFTSSDREGLVEKRSRGKSLNLGSIVTEKDKKHLLLTDEDRKGLL
jgi:hypothetical protein